MGEGEEKGNQAKAEKKKNADADIAAEQERTDQHAEQQNEIWTQEQERQEERKAKKLDRQHKETAEEAEAREAAAKQKKKDHEAHRQEVAMQQFRAERHEKEKSTKTDALTANSDYITFKENEKNESANAQMQKRIEASQQYKLEVAKAKFDAEVSQKSRGAESAKSKAQGELIRTTTSASERISASKNEKLAKDNQKKLTVQEKEYLKAQDIATQKSRTVLAQAESFKQSVDESKQKISMVEEQV